MIYHAVVYIGPASGIRFPEALYDYAWIGAAGVHVFFVISGFIMVLTSWAAFGTRGATGRFLARRFVRIYPIYWIVALLYLAAGALGAIPLGPDPATAVLALLLVPGYGPAIIPPGWTLTYEVYFYLVFAAILLAPRRAALWALAATLCIPVALGVVTGLDQVNALSKHATNVLLLEFLAGAMLGAWHMSGRMPGRLSRRRWLASGLALSVALFVAAPALRRLGVPDIASFGAPSLLVVLVAVAAEGAAPVRQAIARVAWLGDGSYAIYLVHLLVIQLLLPVASPRISGWGGLLAAASLASAASVGLGLLLHYRVEAPLLARLRRRVPRRAAAGPA